MPVTGLCFKVSEVGRVPLDVRNVGVGSRFLVKPFNPKVLFRPGFRK